MSNRHHNHPWVQDYTSFEAVLCCINQIDQWERAATLRAFQTYGFDDANTAGSEELTFRHDTGVLLLCDGDVVAIQYGDGKLTSALSDLFLVLNALGWKEAEVYHPAETLGALLNDMGKAIPGHLDFDVRGAEIVSDPAHFPEAEELKESARNLMQGIQGGSQEFHQLALQEVAAMDPGHPENQSATVATLRESLDEVQPAAMSWQDVDAPVQAIRPYGQPVYLEDDAAPVVPVLVHQQAEVPSSPVEPEIEAQLNSRGAAGVFNESAHDREPAQELSRPVERGPEADGPSPEKRSWQPQNCATVKGRNEPFGSDGESATQANLIRVGQSTIVINRPELAIDLAEICRLADRLGAAEVIHAWPGLVGQARRWDLIGEIDLASPWLSELLSSGLIVDRNEERVCFAAMLLHLARHREGAQLRDLLQQLCSGEQVEACYPLKRLGAERGARFEDAVMDSFGALLLSPEGESFLDVRSETTDIHAFTVRGMLQDQRPMLYVIHLDAVDGAFVESVVNLLEAVALRYSSSTRAKSLVQSKVDEAERLLATQQENERLIVLKEVQEQMASLEALLKKVGLPMPAELAA